MSARDGRPVGARRDAVSSLSMGQALSLARELRRQDFADVLRDTMSPAALGPARTGIAARIVRELSRGRPVSFERLVQITGTEPCELRQALQDFVDMGFAQLDDQDRVVGMVLSLAPTRHAFHLDDRRLYTWCAIDTLFLPAVLDRVAQVESTCPVSGEPVRLRVGPDRVEQGDPGLFVSLVAPGLTPGVPASCVGLTGQDGAFCGQVHFLASEAHARTWEAEHPGSLLLPLRSAFDLAAELWARPFRAAA